MMHVLSHQPERVCSASSGDCGMKHSRFAAVPLLWRFRDGSGGDWPRVAKLSGRWNATRNASCVMTETLAAGPFPAISPGKYQEIGCSLFDSFAKSAIGLTAPASFIVQNRCQSNGNSVFRRPSNHHAEAQASPLSIHPQRRWAYVGVFSASTFDALKTAVPCSPSEVNGRWASTGKCTVTLRECIRRKSSPSTCNKQLILNKLVFEIGRVLMHF